MRRKVIAVNLLILLALTGCAGRSPSGPTESPPSPTPAATIASPATPTPAAKAASPTPTSAPGPSKCTDAAAFVADVTVPDYSHFDPRQTFTKTWRVKNTGTCTWTPEYKAVYSRGDVLGAAASIPLIQTDPGNTLDISTTMTAPVTDGKYEIFYRLSDPSGNPMPIDDGDSLWTLITVGKTVVLPPSTPTPGPTPSAPSGLGTVNCVYTANQAFVDQLLGLINSVRAANSLPALTANDQLSRAAQFHSEDMACNNYLSHTGWDGSTVDSRIAAAGYSASLTRENIYAQPPQYGGTPQSALDWWMNDPIHQAAILNPDVTNIGLGYAYYARSTLGGYFTVDFAKP